MNMKKKIDSILSSKSEASRHTAVPSKAVSLTGSFFKTWGLEGLPTGYSS